jgi:L-iditol 2-dehydrogenase
MRAAILYGKEDLRVEQAPEPALHRGEVRLKIEAALTCGTDLKVYRRGYHARMIVPPAVFGHELSGTIVEVYPEAETETEAEEEEKGWKRGDRVVAANSAPCGLCLYCRKQQENLCDDLLFLNGAYAETIVVPERIVQKNLLRLAPGTPFRDGALVEPLACVMQGLEDIQPEAGEQALVIGSGPIGLLFACVLRHLGCDVTLAGRGSERLQCAAELGAKVVDVAQANLSDALKADASEPFDIVIEAVGQPGTWEAATALVRKGGRVNFFGGCPSGSTVTFDTGRLHYSNLILLASFHHTPRTIRRALELIESGVVRAGQFVDGSCALSELPELFRAMARGNRAVKTLVEVAR